MLLMARTAVLTIRFKPPAAPGHPAGLAPGTSGLSVLSENLITNLQRVASLLTGGIIGLRNEGEAMNPGREFSAGPLDAERRCHAGRL